MNMPFVYKIDSNTFSYLRKKRSILCKDIIERFTEVLSSIELNDEILNFLDDAYESMIDKETDLLTFLYSTPQKFLEHKSEIELLLKMIVKNASRSTDATHRLDLYVQADPYSVHDNNKYLYIHREAMKLCPSWTLFHTFFNASFPKLYFSENCAQSINFFNITKDKEEIIRHLSAINDHAPLIFKEKQHSGDKGMCATLSALGKIEVSPEGDSSKKAIMTFKFKSKNGEKNITCFPHTKMYNRYSDKRIHFNWIHDVNGEDKIPIGHIGKHL